MQRRLLRVAALAGALTSAVAPAAGISAESFNAYVTLTTDYVFRGVSQTREEPAIQGGVGLELENGFFAGLWGSNVDFPNNRRRDEPRNLEIDLFAGYGRDFGRDWSASVTLVRYDYPGADADFNYDYEEAIVAVQFRDQISLAVAYTDDALGSHDGGWSYELAGRHPLPGAFGLVAGVGRYELESPFLGTYDYWSLGLSRSLRRFTFDLTWFGTDGRGERLFGERAGDRLVLSLSAAVQ